MKRLPLERRGLAIIDFLYNHLKFALTQSTPSGFKYMNKEAKQLFGFKSLKEARHFTRKMMFADPSAYENLNFKQQVNGCLQNERVLLNRADKTNFWGSLTSVAIKTDRGIVYDEMIYDVSREVGMEQKLLEKSFLLEKTGDELDRFVYSASHELRSPITTIQGLLKLMQKNQALTSSAEFINMMSTSINKLEANVNKLVEFKRNSNEPIAREKIKLRKLIDDTLTDFEKHPNYLKTEIEILVTDQLPFYSDPAKIKTILHHAIMNSFDFVDHHKSNPFLSIKGNIRPKNGLIEITDNGIGIEKKIVPNVFQMFYRGTASSKGSGLGLYLVREAAVKLNGFVEIHSELGTGTSLAVQIPNMC